MIKTTKKEINNCIKYGYAEEATEKNISCLDVIAISRGPYRANGVLAVDKNGKLFGSTCAGIVNLRKW